MADCDRTIFVCLFVYAPECAILKRGGMDRERNGCSIETMKFSQMNLVPPLQAAVKQSGYETPTPIQRATIPLVLAKKDVLGCAQTGTGKTAAFALPILQLLSQRPRPNRRTIRALVLTPTRELAQQNYEIFRDFGKRLGLTSCVVVGGVSQGAQTQALSRGVDILVATPGRLCDLIGSGFIHLDGIEIFVLDEADRMLDMGFIHDVRRVVGLLPQKRQTLFFSATMPEEVEKLAMSMLTRPETVKIDPVTSTVDAIEQSLYFVDKANKKLLLAHLLFQTDIESALVFTRTRHGADRVARDLNTAGIDSRVIHGDKSQNARQDALNQFKSGKIRVLVATDIAARGIDIAGLSHVINYDVPVEPEAYIHRIGRTGRAGLTGCAITFCCIDEVKALTAIEKITNKRLTRMESPWPMEVLTPSEPKKREPRPKKLGMNGQPLPKPQRRPQAQREAQPARKSTAPRQGTARDAAPEHTAPKAPAAQGRSRRRRRPSR